MGLNRLMLAPYGTGSLRAEGGAGRRQRHNLGAVIIGDLRWKGAELAWRGGRPTANEFTTKDTKNTKGASRRKITGRPAGYPAREARLCVLRVLCGSPATASCLGPGFRRDERDEGKRDRGRSVTGTPGPRTRPSCAIRRCT